MGSDGVLGVRAIKEHLGMAMVQDPASAKYDGMPKSAIGTGVADFVAAAEELPGKLMQYARRSAARRRERRGRARKRFPADWKRFLCSCGLTGGNDFSCYKKSTIDRRIERRMSVHQFNSLPRYVRFLQENPQEVELLHKELLIGVTSFFRDAEMFAFLREKAVPHLLESRPRKAPSAFGTPAAPPAKKPTRWPSRSRSAWKASSTSSRGETRPFRSLPRTSTRTPSPRPVGDISRGHCRRRFLRAARAILRPRRRGLSDQENASRPGRLRGAELLVDPPFTKVDVLCCRNLLIYLNVETQKKLLPLMHYALTPGGLLVLGSAESAGGFSHLFTPLDKKWRVFQRIEATTRPGIDMPACVPHRKRGAMPLPATSLKRASRLSIKERTGHGHSARCSGRSWTRTALLRSGQCQGRHRLYRRTHGKVPGTRVG